MTAHEVPQDPGQVKHVPVLIEEVLAGLQIYPGAVLIDCTLGGGGHTERLLDCSAPDGRVLGLDADPAALRRVDARLGQAVRDGRLIAKQAFFQDVAVVAARYNFDQVDAILLDLGVSSFQLETPERGFSLMLPGPLDMRFDPQQGESAAGIVNEWQEAEIADVIYRYGEERRSRRIAREIVRNRPITTTAQLAEVVERAMGGRKGSRIHPATRTFQALRIAVNAELAQLERALPQCLDLLRPGGRVAVISFHSLEDRIVKQWMSGEASDFVRDPMHPYGGHERMPTLRLITPKPVTATPEEIFSQPAKSFGQAAHRRTDLTAAKKSEARMYQRGAATSAPSTSLSNASISATVEGVESWQAPSAPGWFDAMRQAFALPTTARGFGVFLLVLLLLAAATFMQVLLSAQILDAEMRVGEMQAKLDSIDQRSAEVAWEIAMVSQLGNVAGRARSAGFVPVLEPTYVERPAIALDASSVPGPQPFFAELPPTTEDAVGGSPGEWLGTAEGTTRQTVSHAWSRVVAGVDVLRSIGQ